MPLPGVRPQFLPRVRDRARSAIAVRAVPGSGGAAPGARRHGSRTAGLWMAVAGLLLAWIFFYGTGQALILITGRMEQTSWQSR